MKKVRFGIRFGLLCSLALILLITSCTSGKSGNDSSPTPMSTAEVKQTGTTESKKEKLSLKWFVNGSNNSNLPAKDKDFVKKKIEEKFNVNLEIEHMEIGADFTTKLNLKMAGRDMPDMFMADGAASNTYIKDGLALDLKGIVTPEKMPNYFKYWVSEGELQRYAVQGKFMRAPVPFAKQQYNSYYIRKDWLDNLNAKGIQVKIPETYDEMVEVMKAFTFNDPDNNGTNDTTGLTLFGNGTMLYLSWPEYLKHGLYGLGLKNDQLVDAYSDLKVQQVIEDVRKVIDLKIVDEDWFLQKSGEELNKAAQGKAGIFFSAAKTAALDNEPSSVQFKTKEIYKAAGKQLEADKIDWQPFHPFGKTGVATEALPGAPFMFGKDTPLEKVERSIEILDWLASEEGFLLVRYGEEGTHYTRSGTTITINADAYKTDIIDQGDFLNVYQFFSMADEPQVFGLDVIRPNETDRDRTILEHIKTYKYFPSIGTNVAPPDGYNLADFRNQLYATQVKVLFEEKDASNWPKYREELMEKYGGRAVFEAYAEQMSKAHGRTITFRDK
ncbi:extracellular solute-binding protein [Paenibacillus eucommiae]|uniref:Aldouronate transport system substrate-binding protein n=1 Tax=Paenibacillus eucommiae TaxID=1355755 RepID=A0ABS4JD64_9BACL|nr:extracellular solute-binding protein [Paenibacillus eucommiae]MBP1996674.1 putative aldouronate transport system substrate-binding protein [Paenibacillus eucommiae]